MKIKMTKIVERMKIEKQEITVARSHCLQMMIAQIFNSKKIGLTS